MIMRKTIYAILIVSMISCMHNAHRSKSLELFYDTPVGELAKEISNDNVMNVKLILDKSKSKINYQEPKFGKTLLMATVINEQYEIAKMLLEAGANPNIHDHYNGASAIIAAAGLVGGNEKSIALLKLLLLYGANPNDEEIGVRRKGNTMRNTPLLEACSKSIDRVKLLIDNGANVNYNNEYNLNPLGYSIVSKNLNITLFLLNNGADYTIPTSIVEGKKYYVWDELRFILLPLDSYEYKVKRQIISFLKGKGIEYDRVMIPPYAIQEAKKLYPQTWKQYLATY